MLRERLSKYEMFSEVRGLGLLRALEFKPPRSLLLRAPFEAFHLIHPGMFGQVVGCALQRVMASSVRSAATTS